MEIVWNPPTLFMWPTCRVGVVIKVILQCHLTEWLNVDVYKQLYSQFQGLNPTWYLEGTQFQGGIRAPYQYHGTMEWKTHTIPHSYQYHVSYHTIPYHTIPYHLTSYHTIRGVWGPFTKYEKYFYRLQYLSVGLHFFWTGSSDFCCHLKLQVEAIWWVWSFENQLNWALSQVLAIYTLDNPSHATENWISCQAIWLAHYSSQIS